MLQFRTMSECKTQEQCEQFQMMAFGLSCATCGRSDRECPWHHGLQQAQMRPAIVVRAKKAAAAA